MIENQAEIQIEQIPYYLTWKIRQEVLYPDEPITTVQLPEDSEGLHFGLYKGRILVSVISLFEEVNSIQFRKFATLSDYQGKGLGSLLFNHVLEYIRKQNTTTTEIWCNARIEAIPFYLKFGLKEDGPHWEVKGRSYKVMKIIL